MTGALDPLGHDARHAFRTISRMPGVSAVVVLSLAVGIGMNTVVFSWIQARFFRPLPGVPAGFTFQLLEPRTAGGLYTGMSWREYVDVRDRVDGFRDVLTFRMIPVYLGPAGAVERVFGLLVSENYFSALGVRPVAGRFPGPDDTGPGAAPAAVISYGLWQSRFGGSPAAPGRTLRINGQDLTVIGVAPQAFQGTVLGLAFDVWLPAAIAPTLFPGSRELEDRRVRGYSAMGRLRPGVTREQAQQQLTAAMADLARTYPETNAAVSGEVRPIWQSPRGPQRLLTPALAVLQALMLLLLLAVCGNAATLVLARASARQREIAVRLAIGAAPRRIASLLLAESVTLAVAGAVLAVPIAAWGTRAFQLLPLSGLPIRFQTSVDGAGLAFAMILGVACGIVFGAAPAVQLARVDPQAVFRAGSRSAGRSALRNGLMGVQVALALVVLIAAGSFMRSFLATRHTDPGFRRDGVLLAAYDLGWRGPSGAPAFAARVLDRVRALPGVEGVAIASSVPLDIHGLPSRGIRVEGRTRTEPGSDQALTNTVTPGYFEVMGIPIRRGRDFAGLRDAAAPPQAVVNEAFVSRFLGTLEPLGRRLEMRGRTYFIAGVVRDSLYNAFGEPPTPIVYLSYRDNPMAVGEIHLRTRPGAEHASAGTLRRVVLDLDPEVPVFNVRTLADHVDTNLVFRRVPARMFSLLGPLLLMLAATGIYAVVAYTVSLRTMEIGVRMAIGASARRIIAQVVTESLGVIVLGALLGWSMAFFVAMALGAVDAAVFAGVPFLLLLVAAFACWLPARRITRVDPVIALRVE